MTKIESCPEMLDDKPCGQQVTDEVTWADISRPEYPPTTPENPHRGFVIGEDGRIRYTHFYPHLVVRRVCTGCADALMSWRASHLSPRRTAA